MTQNSWKFSSCDVRNSLDCGICFESQTKINKFPCNHRFCNDCLNQYVTIQVKEEGGLTGVIKCPGEQCLYELEDESVISIIGQEVALKNKYLQLIANSFVQNNRAMKWCPNALCQNAVLLEAGAVSQLFESIRCSCGFRFCFKCHNISHDPVNCEMLLEWAKVKAEDMDAQNWILKNTKPCPSCSTDIEKNGGCMHMTCKKCRFEFCWVCMGLWKSHHACAGAVAVSRNDINAENVRRFMEYNTKHEVMKQAFDLDNRKYKHLMDDKMELEMEDQWIKIEFVAEAVEILLECRRTLMHSYIFSYFMTTIDNQMYIFEKNLQYLEQLTEELSEIIEHEITAETVQKLKEKIIDATVICAKRRRTLIDHIIEGKEKNWWRKFPIPPQELIAAEIQANADEALQRLLY
jgi:ariadne-1